MYCALYLHLTVSYFFSWLPDLRHDGQNSWPDGQNSVHISNIFNCYNAHINGWETQENWDWNVKMFELALT